MLEGFYGGSAGGGKALWIHTPIKTARGWTTLGEIRLGDWVYSPTGDAVQVVACSEIMEDRPCYEFVFSDGAKIISDAEHDWVTMDATERHSVIKRNGVYRENRRRHRPSRSLGRRPDLVRLNQAREHDHLQPSVGELRTTEEIARSVYYRKSRTNHSIEVCNPLKHASKKLLLDPYVLGVWLGDGSTNAGNITSADPEIISEITDTGFYVNKHNGAEYSYGVHGLATKLRMVGVFGCKHIPEVYINAPIADRVALLQGLMDTDGTVTNAGYPEIQLTNKKLIDGVIELLISLGIKATVRVGRAKLYGKDCGAKYRIKYVTDIPVFRLSRKLHRQKRDGFRGTHKRRYIKEANSVQSVPVRCIKVDSDDGMFLIGRELIPTHNSDALLMAALQFVEVQGYSALLLRRTFTDLSMAEALMDRAQTWLSGTDAHWRELTKTWSFPSGATLTFGYLDNERAKFRYQGAAFTYIGFDELTQFPATSYKYLFSRLRRLTGTHVPIRMRSASNPGDIGHNYVKARFITPSVGDLLKKQRFFIPALLEDNPHLDAVTYDVSLAKLDPVTREQLRYGNWDVTLAGGMFEREWFQISSIPVGTQVRAWDMAATAVGKNKDPDWTVGTLMVRTPQNRFCVVDVVRFRKRPGDTKKIIKQTAEMDGVDVKIVMEQEPGSSGVIAIDDYATDVLTGYSFGGVLSTGSKVVRAQPFSAACSNGNVSIAAGAWNADFVAELSMFPQPGVHDDQVDAASLAFSVLTQRRAGGFLPAHGGAHRT